jgi:hypothetical protein
MFFCCGDRLTLGRESLSRRRDSVAKLEYHQPSPFPAGEALDLIAHGPVSTHNASCAEID